MSKKKSTDLENGSIGKLLVTLAVPSIIAQIVNLLYNIVDRIFIGRMPNGDLAMAGIGIITPIVLLVTAFSALVGFGGSPRVAIKMGQKDNDGAEEILGNSFSLVIIIGLILTVIFYIFKEPIVMAFGASENTIDYAVAYMNIYAFGTVFVQITLGMNLFITAQGFAKTGMLSVLLGAVTNIILDPVFIFGFHMGVRGAALATILSQALSCIWVLCFLFGKKTILKLKKRYMTVKKEILFPCLALGSSVFIMQSSESVISVCFNSSLLKYGGDLAVGAMTILTSVMQFAMLPLQGLGQGAQPIISYNYGAGNKERVKGAFWLLLKCSMFYSVLFWAVVMLFPQMFVGMFTSDAVLAAFTRDALKIYMAVVGLFGIQMACQITFGALGNAKASILVAVMRKFVLLIPLIYIMPAIFTADKARAVYMAEPVADTLAITFTGFLFFFQFRKVLRQMNKNTDQ